MDEATIETRVRRLEDIEAIRKLKALCCLHVDREDSEAFADLFVEDGAFIGAFQELRGREAIREIRFWPFMVLMSAIPSSKWAAIPRSGSGISSGHTRRTMGGPTGRPEFTRMNIAGPSTVGASES